MCVCECVCLCIYMKNLNNNTESFKYKLNFLPADSKRAARGPGHFKQLSRSRATPPPPATFFNCDYCNILSLNFSSTKTSNQLKFWPDFTSTVWRWYPGIKNPNIWLGQKISQWSWCCRKWKSRTSSAIECHWWKHSAMSECLLIFFTIEERWMQHFTANCWITWELLIATNDATIRDILLLHDNARPHTAALTRDKLGEMYWTLFEHFFLIILIYLHVTFTCSDPWRRF